MLGPGCCRFEPSQPAELDAAVACAADTASSPIVPAAASRRPDREVNALVLALPVETIRKVQEKEARSAAGTSGSAPLGTNMRVPSPAAAYSSAGQEVAALRSKEEAVVCAARMSSQAGEPVQSSSVVEALTHCEGELTFAAAAARVVEAAYSVAREEALAGSAAPIASARAAALGRPGVATSSTAVVFAIAWESVPNDAANSVSVARAAASRASEMFGGDAEKEKSVESAAPVEGERVTFRAFAWGGKCT